MSEPLNVVAGDKIKVIHSPYVWKVTTVRPDGWIKCKVNGRSYTFPPSEVLAVVERKAR